MKQRSKWNTALSIKGHWCLSNQKESRLLPIASLQQCFSKCCPWTSSIHLAESLVHLRSTESETLGWSSATHTVPSPHVIQMDRSSRNPELEYRDFLKQNHEVKGECGQEQEEPLIHVSGVLWDVETEIGSLEKWAANRTSPKRAQIAISRLEKEWNCKSSHVRSQEV